MKTRPLPFLLAAAALAAVSSTLLAQGMGGMRGGMGGMGGGMGGGMSAPQSPATLLYSVTPTMQGMPATVVSISAM